MPDSTPNTDMMDPEMLALLRERLRELQASYAENQSKIAAIDAQLASWVPGIFRQKSNNNLLIERDDLITTNTGLNELIVGLQNALNEDNQKLKAANLEIMRKTNNDLIASLVKEYKKDSTELFKQIHLFFKKASNPLSVEDQVKLFTLATKVIYVQNEFNSEIKLENLKAAYDIVELAKKTHRSHLISAVKDGKVNELKLQMLNLQDEFYTAGAAQMLNTFSANLPMPWQNLRVLYAAGKIETVKTLISELMPAIRIDDKESISSLTMLMAREIDAVNLSKAKQQLQQTAGYERLPVEVKQQLIEQRIFVNKLEADLQYVDPQHKEIYLAEIENFSKKLSNNIANVLENYRSAAEGEKDFADIKAKIDARSNELRNRILKEHGKDITKIGLGTGAAYGLGLITPPLAALAVGYMLYQKMNVEQERPEDEQVVKERALAAKLAPVDYNFIQAQDEFWGVNPSIPVSEIKIEGTDFIEQSKESAKKFIGEKTEAVTGSVTEQTTQVSGAFKAGLKVMTGLSIVAAFTFMVATIVMLAIGIGFPPVWPLLAALGFAIVIGQVIMAAKYSAKSNEPTTVVDKIVAAINFPADIITRIFARPISSISANFSRGNTKSGYAIVFGISALVITGAVLLPLMAPVLGVAGGIILGATAGGVLGTMLGASVSEFLGFKGSKETVLRKAGVADTAMPFNLSSEAEQKLDRLAPTLARKLTDHFRHRAQNIQAQIVAARSSNDSAASAIISNQLDKMEHDWQDLTRKINDPVEFCKAFEQYLDAQYNTAREGYIADAADRKDKLQDIGSKRANMIFDKKDRQENASAFNMQIPVDFKAARGSIEELHDLKSIVRNIKLGAN